MPRVPTIDERIVAYLKNAPDNAAPAEDICDHIWGADPAGGPLHMDGCFAVHLHRLRQTGHEIKLERVYRLVSVPRASWLPRKRRRVADG